MSLLSVGSYLIPIVLLLILRVKGNRRRFVIRMMYVQLVVLAFLCVMYYQVSDPFHHLFMFPLANFLFIAAYIIGLSHPSMFEKAEVSD